MSDIAHKSVHFVSPLTGQVNARMESDARSSGAPKTKRAAARNAEPGDRGSAAYSKVAGAGRGCERAKRNPRSFAQEDLVIGGRGRTRRTFELSPIFRKYS